MNVTRTWRFLAVAVLLAMLAAACGGGDDTSSDDAATADDAAAEDDAAADEATDDAADESADDADDDAGDDAADAGDSGDSGEPFESPEDGVYADRVDYGFIYDQTGPTASTQTVFFAGFEAHIEAVNAAGGVHGREINILEEDERYDVATGVAAYQRLVNQTPVVGMTALNNSSFQGAVIEEVDANGVAIVGAESTSESAINPYRELFFAMECTYADQADVAVAYSAELNGGEVPRTITIYGNVASGEEYHNQIQERVEHAGGEYLGGFSIEYGATEFDAQAQEIASLDVQHIHLHGGVSIGIPVLSSLEKFGVTDVPVTGIFAMHAPDVPESGPSIPFAAVNCYANAYEGIEGADELIADAQAAGDDPELYERAEYANGWVVAKTVVAALEAAGDELTRESFAAAVESIEGLDVGALAPAVTFGEGNRVGVASVMPFEFDPDSGTFSAVGAFDDYRACLTNEYIEGSLGDYDPTSCVGS